MSKKLTIMFTPMDGVGHVNGCIGLAEILQTRGHQIVFVTDPTYKGKLAKYGFTEEFLTDVKAEDKKLNPGENAINRLLKEGILGLSPLDRLKSTKKSNFRAEMLKNMIADEPRLKQLTKKYKPDLYIIDHFVGSPTLIYSDKPWVYIWSGNPLIVIDDERAPPGGSGFASNDKDREKWSEFRELRRDKFIDAGINYNKYLSENGFPTIDSHKMIPESPYLNIYGYPEELDYTDLRPIPDKWFRVDALMRQTEPGHFEIPDQLKNRDEIKQKLIYLSLGSMGSADIQLMNRLINILSKSVHKYIVSKGIYGQKYELPDNMWGQNSVPQTKVLPLVDLVITHGGNNTITETFTFGKPMIVMPLFGDQFDNAQRVQEKGYGIRVEPYSCTEEELLGAVEKLLNDENMRQRLSIASKRMQTSDSLTKAAELIEKLV